MNKPELTFEEFCKVPLLYMWGVRFEWGALVWGDIYSGWHPETRAYFLDGDPREFKTIDQVYVAYMEKVCKEEQQ